MQQTPQSARVIGMANMSKFISLWLFALRYFTVAISNVFRETRRSRLQALTAADAAAQLQYDIDLT
jgi:hypothetical protein